MFYSNILSPSFASVKLFLHIFQKFFILFEKLIVLFIFYYFMLFLCGFYQFYSLLTRLCTRMAHIRAYMRMRMQAQRYYKTQKDGKRRLALYGAGVSIRWRSLDTTRDDEYWISTLHFVILSRCVAPSSKYLIRLWRCFWRRRARELHFVHELTFGHELQIRDWRLCMNCASALRMRCFGTWLCHGSLFACGSTRTFGAT